jgi:hypothetical protein
MPEVESQSRDDLFQSFVAEIKRRVAEEYGTPPPFEVTLNRLGDDHVEISVLVVRRSLTDRRMVASFTKGDAVNEAWEFLVGLIARAVCDASE